MAELTPAERERRRQAPTTHGGFSYLARVRDGEPVTVTMADIERSVLAEIETDGPAERVKKQAARLGTAAELLWSYMQQGEVEFNKGLKHWGWMVSAEIRAWRDWRELTGKADVGAVDYEKLLEAKRNADNTTD